MPSQNPLAKASLRLPPAELRQGGLGYKIHGVRLTPRFNLLQSN